MMMTAQSFPVTKTDAHDLRDDAFWDGEPSIAPPEARDVTEAPEASSRPGAPSRNAPPSKASMRDLSRREQPRVKRRGIGRVETRGRARALQAVYAADLRDYSQLRKLAVQVFDDLAITPEERQFATRLVSTLVDRGAEVDESLAAVTANWRLDRLGAIERSVLRLAAAELMRGETPPRVVLQEAIHLAERYGTARSARFVNGVLDAYARRLGVL